MKKSYIKVKNSPAEIFRKVFLVHFLQGLVILKFSIFPEIVQACAVCFSGKEETLEAFYVTTIFLTLLPIVMLALIGFWLYRKYRKIS